MILPLQTQSALYAVLYQIQSTAVGSLVLAAGMT